MRSDFNPYRAASCKLNSCGCEWERCWWLNNPKECIDFKPAFRSKRKPEAAETGPQKELLEAHAVIERLARELRYKEAAFERRVERLRARNVELVERLKAVAPSEDVR